MMKRSLPITRVMLALASLLIVGCSAFHEVSVVSHGDEKAVQEEAVPEMGHVTPLPSSRLGSAVAPLKQEQEQPALSVMPPAKSLPLVPPSASPSGKESSGREIFAQAAEDTTLPWTLQDVFFDYDQMAIRKDAIPLLEQNAQVLLRRYANREVLIQGHCDERGTEAYNLVLGERRAKAVKSYLVNLGVAASRLRVLSLGKSQPFCLERTISCFRQNRRAHFILK